MPNPSGAKNGEAADVEIETVGEWPGWNLWSDGGKVGVVLKYGECILFQEKSVNSLFRSGWPWPSSIMAELEEERRTQSRMARSSKSGCQHSPYCMSRIRC